MSLNFNGTEPTAVTFNGSNVNVVRMNSTYVWGKPFSLSVSAGTGTTVTVNRTSSPYQNAATGTISNGSVVYYGDVLAISVSLGTAYNISSFTVNGTFWTSGSSITVTSAISVISSATVKSYALSLSAGTGTTITANRTSSPYQGASTGTISAGTIYYGDVLQISASASSGYTLSSFTVNGSTWSSGSSITTTANVSVVSTAAVSYRPFIFTVANGTNSQYVNIYVNAGSNGATITFAGVTKTVTANSGANVIYTSTDTATTSGQVTVSGSTSCYVYTYTSGKSTTRWVGVSGITQFDSDWTGLPDDFMYNQTAIAGVITLPDTYTSIGENAFRGCTGITKVVAKNVMDYQTRCFYGCTALTRVATTSGTTSVFSPKNGSSIGDTPFTDVGITTYTIGSPSYLGTNVIPLKSTVSLWINGYTDAAWGGFAVLTPFASNFTTMIFQGSASATTVDGSISGYSDIGYPALVSVSVEQSVYNAALNTDGDGAYLYSALSALRLAGKLAVA